MQLFSIGNLITFFAVLLILVILRALDRNNRSLEKLKRFSDKIAANISAVADEKTAQVRELAMGLQGSLAAGKELVVKARAVDEALQAKARSVEESFQAKVRSVEESFQARTKTVEEALLARTTEVEGIRKRLLDYEKSFSDLASVSSRLDQVLKKLRDQSDVADSVGKRIGESAARVEKLEKKLPEIEAGSGARARQALEAARTEIVSAVEAKVGTLASNLNASEKRLKDFSAYMARLEAREEQAEKERAAYLSRSLEAFEADVNGKLSRARERGETLEEEVFGRLLARIKEDEATFAKNVEAIERRLADYQSDVDYRVKSLEESSDMDALRASLDESIAKTAAGAHAKMKEIAANLVAGWQTEIAAATSARDELHAGLAEVHAGLEELKTKAYQDVEKGLSVFEDEFFADLRQRAAQSLDKYQVWQKDMDKRMEGFEGELKARLVSSEEAMHGVGDAMRAEVEKARKDASLAIEKETGGLREALDGAVRKAQREIETRLRELSTELETGRKELGDVLDGSRADVVAWEGRARQQLSETEVSVAEKISLLASEAQSSIGVVRDEFGKQKDQMLAVFTQEKNAIKTELKDLGERISAFEGDLKRSSESALEGMRAQMEKAGKGTTAALEKELAGVKEALESRSAAMHGQIDARMKELAGQLEAGRKETAAQTESALGAIRSGFASERDELIAVSSQEREALKKQIAEMGDKIGSFDAELSRTTDSTMEAIQVLREALHEEVEKARGEASLAMEKDLASLRESLEGASRRMEKEIEARMGSITAETEANRKEVSQLLEASSKYVTAWEAKTRQRLSESEAAIAKKMSALESEAGSSAETIRQAFVVQKEELVAASAEERAAFKAEMAEVGQKIAALRAELAASSQDTIQTLQTQAEVMQTESQKRIHDFQADVETRIKEYRQFMSDTREKAELTQEKLSARIDESYRLMSTNLADIDKRVKSFTAQTRLFERADSLKTALEGNVEELKKEITKLAAEKAELADTELQLSRTKKLADEVSTKLSRFLTEKRRIDEMEGEFKKLLTLSRDIDLKVNTLSGSHDALQQIQAKVREFEEMGKVVETGVERLDKKQQIITVTAEGVDKNFQRLESMEKIIKETDQEASALESKVRSLMAEYDMLAGRKKDAETAVEISGRLSSVIEELEQRLEKAQNSREWMARTETRFEEIGRQAQEQVRLLESIVKSETKKEKGERGAPPLDKRDTVVKLSHQGWSVQEISRVTQLSRGEVELILELAPKV